MARRALANKILMWVMIGLLLALVMLLLYLELFAQARGRPMRTCALTSTTWLLLAHWRIAGCWRECAVATIVSSDRGGFRIARHAVFAHLRSCPPPRRIYVVCESGGWRAYI